jgi:adenine C2-methylase RlmN of 23S rRNA A2503 and tRNA A37
MEEIMKINMEEEEARYLAELQAGEYTIELNPNDGSDHDLKEQRDLEAFKEDLKSENFKSFVAEALS